MAERTHTLDVGTREIADAGADDEVARLRRDLVRCRDVFDSARLVVGHEFTRPLTAASGYLDLLEERLGGSIDDTGKGYVEKMRSALARLEEIVESVVQMLRIEHAGGPFSSLEVVDVRCLLDRVRERFAGGGARIEIRVPPELPSLLLQRACIEVVAENLVSNAVSHGGGAPVIVSVELASGRGGFRGDCLVLAVEDRGAGIPEDKIEEVFAPFVRLDTGAGHEGLGLGLPLVKSVVAILRGQIEVRSAPGEGTVVTVIVPVGGDGEAPPDTIG